EFGGSIGGPVIIPKLYNGKNKTFFFFAYERFSLRQNSNELVTVPTVAMRESGVVALAANGVVMSGRLLAARNVVRIVACRAGHLAAALPKTRRSAQPVSGAHEFEFFIAPLALLMVEKQHEIPQRLARPVRERTSSIA